ncbi:MAG: hypothetical protein F2842_08555 [Actinobacteria bacterium]|nr:hypothetical protein [Actinomycetota bacterium]
MLGVCSSADSSSSDGGVSASMSPAVQVQRTPITKDRAKEFFLATVCPVATSLKIIDNLWINPGGWKAVVPSTARPYTQSASAEARKAATALTAGGVAWPDGLLSSINGMEQNFLSMIVPLEAMVNAPTGAAMEAPWSKVALNPRIAEQQARIDLGLPAADAANDGCPPVPRSKPKPVALPKPKPTSDADISGGSGQSERSYGEWLCGADAEGLPGFSAYSRDGRSVAMLQWALKSLGDYQGDIGGNYGPQTFIAVRSFQLGVGLGGSGDVGPNTWGAIQRRIC